MSDKSLVSRTGIVAAGAAELGKALRLRLSYAQQAILKMSRLADDRGGCKGKQPIRSAGDPPCP
ncbi:hypothetical protein X737_24975 [Mesorhizobium sp. L48C026A00]|nr:hypothetical protein X737_24975 [Mesorhizobium sp. L48C026A00]